MSRKKNPNSRWLSGAKRYPDAVEQEILIKYREQPGWFAGAKVRKRQ